MVWQSLDCIINQSSYMEKATTSQPNKQVTQLDSAVALLLDPNAPNDFSQQARALQNVFDLLLWAQKKNHQALQSLFQIDFLTQIVTNYPNHLQSLISGLILLFGNAKEDGPLVTHLLQRKLGDKIITKYLQQLSKQSNLQQQQQLHCLGGLLRVYHRHFNQANYHLYIDNGRCLLIEVCCSFFNCPEEITRTSVMNILMSILKVGFMGELVSVESIRVRVGIWCRDMCRLFRNELKDFDQQMLITDQKQSEFIIHSINDKIILWEDLSSLNPELFAPHFYGELLVPLIVGALNTTGVPLFTLKFSLFLVNKLVPTISKLNLLNKLGSLLFQDRQVLYTDDQLGAAILPQFSLQKLLQDTHCQSQQTQLRNTFKHLNQSFLNILRSKDGRFLECVCILLVNLLSSVKKQPTAIEFYVKKLGFGMGGASVTQISHAMITQFTAVHSLEITRIIAASLVYIQPVKYLDEELTRRLVHVFKSNIDQAVTCIQKQRQVHPALAQIFQYDVRNIQSKQFSLDPIMKSDAALLFNNHIIENQTLPFYQQLPETTLHVTRYQIVKALFLRNVVKRLVEECSGDNSIERYMQKMRAIDSKYIKAGQNIRLPLSVNSYRCKLQDSKVTIPNCLILDDQNNFIVGFCQNSNIRVISNFKYKHVHTEVHSKKEHLFIEVSTVRYNMHSQQMDFNKEFILRQLDVGEEYFRVKKSKIVAQEIAWICDIFRYSRRNLPEFSLL